MLSFRQILLLFIVLAFSSCTQQKEEAKKYLDHTNSIKHDIDILDNAIYEKYTTVFLNIDSELYGKHNSEEYQNFINVYSKKYDSLLIQVDTLTSSQKYPSVQNSLREFLLFQKDGLNSYYTKILTLEKLDRKIDSSYNSRFQELQHLFFAEQINLANSYGIIITNDKKDNKK